MAITLITFLLKTFNTFTMYILLLKIADLTANTAKLDILSVMQA